MEWYRVDQHGRLKFSVTTYPRREPIKYTMLHKKNLKAKGYIEVDAAR